MNRKLTALIVFAFVLIFLPVVLMGLMMSVNEYTDQGIGGSVDCNGPLTVMIFIAPCMVVYTFGAIYYALLLTRVKRSLASTGLLILCVVILCAAANKAWSAYVEKSRPEHRESCGTSW